VVALKIAVIAFWTLVCSAKPAQQLQIQSGEHKSASGAWFSESVLAWILVGAGVSISAASAQGIHDRTVMKILRRIANHFIRCKINKNLMQFDCKYFYFIQMRISGHV
jgi:hypothetical protein